MKRTFRTGTFQKAQVHRLFLYIITFMTEKIKKSWGKGPLKIYDAELECFVLEDGTTVLNKAKMMNAIGRPWK
jgi:hypothetical protein